MIAEIAAMAYASKSPTHQTPRMFEALGNYRDACRGMLATEMDVTLYLWCLSGMAARLGEWIDHNRIEGDAEAKAIVDEYLDLCLRCADFTKLRGDGLETLRNVTKRAAHFAEGH